MVNGVSNASDCCLGIGLSFRNNGTCRQCIGKRHALISGYITSGMQIEFGFQMRTEAKIHV